MDVLWLQHLYDGIDLRLINLNSLMLNYEFARGYTEHAF